MLATLVQLQTRTAALNAKLARPTLALTLTLMLTLALIDNNTANANAIAAAEAVVVVAVMACEVAVVGALRSS